MGRVNPWLKDKIAEAVKSASPLRYIVEVRPELRAQVKAKLFALPDLAVESQPADRFIVVSAPPELVERIAAIEGVEVVSAETLAWIKGPIPILGIPTPREALKMGPPSKFNHYLGQIKLSAVEIPVGPAQALALAPVRALQLNNIIVFTTDDQRKYIGAPEDNKIKTRCAVADTGGVMFPHPLIHSNSSVNLKSVIPFEPLPIDNLGHGTWCQTCAYGDHFTHPRWGKLEGVADPDEQLSVKCLSAAGFGMTSWILEAIYRAWEWGAKVLSLSLGGPLQASALDDDPTCRLIAALKDQMIAVVAAGNDGPAGWTIGSPGAAPDAVTVGAWSMTDNDVSYFSSRGPSGEFYRDNPDVWARDLAKVGDDLVKPDVCCPGGGRRDSVAKDEQILSGCSPWYDIYGGGGIPGFGVMAGTSMATPSAAGLIALALDRGLVKTAKDIKAKMARNEKKNAVSGYGLTTWAKLQ